MLILSESQVNAGLGWIRGNALDVAVRRWTNEHRVEEPVCLAHSRLSPFPRRSIRAAIQIPPLSFAPAVFAADWDSFQHVDVLLSAYFFEDLWPDGDADFAKVCLLEYQHVCTRLSDPAANAERKLVLDDSLVVW